MLTQQTTTSRRSRAKTAPALVAVQSIFRAFVSTIVPESAALDERGWNELEANVEEALRERPAGMHRQLRVFLRVIQAISVLRYGRPFTALDGNRRANLLSHLQDHALQLIRTGFWGLRTLAFLGYYGRLDAGREIGYVPDPRGWEARR